jgi:hypothetical protein
VDVIIPTYSLSQWSVTAHCILLEKVTICLTLGAPFQLYVENLPTILDFGNMCITATEEIEFQITNDCPHLLDILAMVYTSPPVDATQWPAISKGVCVIPPKFILKPTRDEDNR